MRQEKPISTPSVSLPKGGGAIAGIGEAFQAAEFTGSASLSIPIHTSPCRGFEPKLSLDYSSGAGNGVFGVGFSLAVPDISRKTDKGIPNYNDNDTFLISGADDLVPKLVKKGDWVPDVATATENGIEYAIARYRPRSEGLFARIERWTRKDNADAHWRVTSKDNVTSHYGESKQARITHPKHESRIFRWLIERSYDAKGNQIAYEYEADAPDSERPLATNAYLTRIKYGNQPAGKANTWHFEVVFDYSESFDFKKTIASEPDKAHWVVRTDPFSSYKSGFEIRTRRLCQRVLMVHRFKVDDPFLVNATHFEYDATPSMTTLKRVRHAGYRGDAYREMPPLEFTWSQPWLKASTECGQPEPPDFKPLRLEAGEEVADFVDKGANQMVDLYGEGLPGILHTDDEVVLYSRPAGEGNYDSFITPQAFPIERDVGKAGRELLDLDGGGKLDLVVTTAANSGYYESTATGGWEPFRAFASTPTELRHPQRQMVDVTGDGLADLVLFEEGTVKFYPSEGKHGYSAPRSRKTEAPLPVTSNPDARELIRFTDVFGDGGNHLVRIRSGSVECWPNLGYGSFGTKVEVANAPHFEKEFDASRLFLTDIDGSGTTDLVYARSDRVDIYFNQSGNAFSDAVPLPLPAAWSDLGQISFADVLGSGSACLVLTALTDDLTLDHRYYDFAQGIKPHLLTGVDNHMGATTRIGYSPSTKFYLADRKAGRPWVTRLPFPVQVVERIETNDLISDSKLVSTFTYHHGYFDPAERQFRGFGRVERQDAETFDASQAASNKTTSTGSDGAELHVPPTLTKTWYHTGNYADADTLSRHHASEYYQGDDQAHALPDTVLEDDFRHASPEDVSEAYNALHGQVLREEVFGLDHHKNHDLDNPELDEHPYTVTESNYRVRLLQPKGQQKHAVCLVHPGETISYHYERNPADPRIEHDFTVGVDDYGNMLESCQVFYGRRDGADTCPVQQPERLKAVATIDSFINVDPTVDPDQQFYALGLPSEEKTFELGGLAQPGRKYFSASDVAAHLRRALKQQIPFEQALGTSAEARLLTWMRHRYWNPSLAAPLDAGQVSAQVLPHSIEKAAFSPAYLETTFDKRLTEDVRLDRSGGGEDAPGGGYVLKDGYWWNPGLTQHYLAASGYYLPAGTVDAFGAKTDVVYDDFKLLPVTITDDDGNQTHVELDYHALQPRLATDANDNKAEVMFDPLGLIVATSVYGSERGDAKGDKPLANYEVRDKPTSAKVLKSPAHYLQHATKFFFYDLSAWKDRSQPPHSVHLLRETHVEDLPSDKKTNIQIHIAYSDGFGRHAQTKVKAGPGLAFARDKKKLRRDDRKRPIHEATQERWITSGRTVYNNKGKAVKEYEPFYSATPEYEAERELTEHGATHVTHYDPVLRVIRIDTPDGFHSKVEFSPWEIAHFDENDTLEDSPFFNTPEIDVLDTQGHAVRTIQLLEPRSSPANDANAPSRTTLVTHHEFDVQGRQRSTTDPRAIRCFECVYDMTGATLYTKSADAGKRWALHNVAGNPLHVWDSRGFRISTRYDALQRVVDVHVSGEDKRGLHLDNTVESMVYGGTVAAQREDDKRLNSCGKLVTHNDQAGTVSFDAYDIHGKPLASTRRLLRDVKHEPNWPKGDGSALLEDERFKTEWDRDALGRIAREVHADGSVSRPEFHPEGWLKRLVVDLAGSPVTTNTFVEEISYNAKGQQTGIKYGNQVTSTHTYDERTFRLSNLHTTRDSDTKDLQDIHYDYDPAGNITSIRDASHKSVFAGQEHVTPLCKYTYDALYRLETATGREHPALAGNEYQNAGDNVFKHSRFLNLDDSSQLRTYTQSYAYDPGGNLTKISHKAKRSWTRRMVVADKSNCAVFRDDPPAPQAVSDFFDDHGNQIDIEHISGDVRWNYRDNVASVALVVRENQPFDAEYYSYDSGGVRVRKVSETLGQSGGVVETTETIYLNGVEIKRVTSKAVNKLEAASELKTTSERWSLHVSDGPDCLAIAHHWTAGSRKGDRQIRYQLDNHLGSVSLELAKDAAIISYEEYFPYGGTALIASKDSTEVKSKRYRYSGKERDDSTGLYYYGARYYAPWLGRWISPDPAGTIDGLNLYVFVGNNPVGHFDVGGHGRVKQTARKGKGKKKKTWHPRVTGSAFIELKRNNFTTYDKRFARMVMRHRKGGKFKNLKLNLKKEDLAQPHRVPYNDMKKRVKLFQNTGDSATLVRWTDRLTDARHAKVKQLKSEGLDFNQELGRRLTMLQHLQNSTDSINASRTQLIQARARGDVSGIESHGQELLDKLNSFAVNIGDLGPHTKTNAAVQDHLHLNVTRSGALTPASDAAGRMTPTEVSEVATDSSGKYLVTPTGHLFSLANLKPEAAQLVNRQGTHNVDSITTKTHPILN